MNKHIMLAAVAAVTLGLIPVIHFNWPGQETAPPADLPREPAKVLPPVVESDIQHPMPEVPEASSESGEPPPPSLPELDQSDPVMVEAISSLLAKQSLLKLFSLDNIIQRIVVSVDNMTGATIPHRFNPVKPVAGKFLTHMGGKDRWLIDPENYRRYDLYVKMLEAVDTEDVLAIYTRFYPLFQQAYVELGYPNKYFNDRLVTVLEHLLETPEVAVPLVLVRPKVTYKYEDTRFERLSAGQKLLLRMGPENGAKMRVLIKRWHKKILTLPGKG